MAAIKKTMVFALTTGPGTGTRVGGWTESFYDTNLAAPLTTFENLCQFRAACLPQQAQIVGQRYQQVDPVGASQTGSRVFPGGAGFNTDIPQMSLLVRCTSATLNIRPYYIRGIPDLQVALGAFAPTDAYKQALLDYYDRITAGSWQFRARDKTQVRFKLQKIDTLGGVTKVYSQLATPWVVGNTLSITGARLPNGLVLRKEVEITAKPDAFTSVVVGWGLPDTVLGSAVRLVILYPVITGIQESRIVTRKVGRPSTGYRGRKSTARRMA